MTLTKTDLNAIGSLIDQKLNPIDKRLAKIEKEVKTIKNDTTYI